MKRKKYSASTHHTMSELNITPLLDLAFVLLVIFIITTAPAVNDMNISLPTAASRPKDAAAKVNYITVDNVGKIFLNTVEMTEPELLRTLVEFRKQDPDLNVVVRGDSRIQYQKIVSVLDVLVSANVSKVGLATEFAAN
jgi:biopolymer transport protein ExbD